MKKALILVSSFIICLLALALAIVFAPAGNQTETAHAAVIGQIKYGEVTVFGITFTPSSHYIKYAKVSGKDEYYLYLAEEPGNSGFFAYYEPKADNDTKNVLHIDGRLFNKINQYAYKLNYSLNDFISVSYEGTESAYFYIDNPYGDITVTNQKPDRRFINVTGNVDEITIGGVGKINYTGGCLSDHSDGTKDIRLVNAPSSRLNVKDTLDLSLSVICNCLRSHNSIYAINAAQTRVLGMSSLRVTIDSTHETKADVSYAIASPSNLPLYVQTMGNVKIDCLRFLYSSGTKGVVLLYSFDFVSAVEFCICTAREDWNKPAKFWNDPLLDANGDGVDRTKYTANLICYDFNEYSSDFYYILDYKYAKPGYKAYTVNVQNGSLLFENVDFLGTTVSKFKTSTWMGVRGDKLVVACRDYDIDRYYRSRNYGE